jgi:hypothetical protein
MSLMQLPKVITAINELAVKVQQLEVQVKTLLEDKANRDRTPKPTKKTD